MYQHQELLCGGNSVLNSPSPLFPRSCSPLCWGGIGPLRSSNLITCDSFCNPLDLILSYLQANELNLLLHFLPDDCEWVGVFMKKSLGEQLTSKRAVHQVWRSLPSVFDVKEGMRGWWGLRRIFYKSNSALGRKSPNTLHFTTYCTLLGPSTSLTEKKDDSSKTGDFSSYSVQSFPSVPTGTRKASCSQACPN